MQLAADDFIAIETLDISITTTALTKFGGGNTVHKNDWRKWFPEECSGLGINDVNSKCMYFDVFDTPAKLALDFTKSFEKGIPR